MPLVHKVPQVPPVPKVLREQELLVPQALQDHKAVKVPLDLVPLVPLVLQDHRVQQVLVPLVPLDQQEVLAAQPVPQDHKDPAGR